MGTSTLGLLLAVALREGEAQESPDRDVVLLEADRSGGTAGARFDLGVAGGLQAWVAGLAADPTVAVTQFGRRIADGLRVVPAPVGTAETERILTRGVSDMLAAAITRDSDRLWVVDVGRGGEAAVPLTTVADVAVLVTLGLAEQIVRLPSMVRALHPVPCVVMVGGPTAWSTGEIHDHCGATAVIDGPEYRMPADQVVDLVEGRRRRRSLPWRSVLHCRDAVVETAGRAGAEPQIQPADNRSVG